MVIRKCTDVFKNGDFDFFDVGVGSGSGDSNGYVGGSFHGGIYHEGRNFHEGSAGFSSII